MILDIRREVSLTRVIAKQRLQSQLDGEWGTVSRSVEWLLVSGATLQGSHFLRCAEASWAGSSEVYESSELRGGALKKGSKGFGGGPERGLDGVAKGKLCF